MHVVGLRCVSLNAEKEEESCSAEQSRRRRSAEEEEEAAVSVVKSSGAGLLFSNRHTRLRLGKVSPFDRTRNTGVVTG